MATSGRSLIKKFGQRGDSVLKDIDRGYNRLISRLGRYGLDGHKVAVGVIGKRARATHKPPGRKTKRKQKGRTPTLKQLAGEALGKPRKRMRVVDIAAIHEFGAPGAKIPSRSFIRSTASEKKLSIQKVMVRSVRGFVKDKLTAEQAMGVIGSHCVSLIQSKIQSNIPPALAQSTIDRKGSSVALINTGQLVQSIAYEVRTKRSRKSKVAA